MEAPSIGDPCLSVTNPLIPGQNDKKQIRCKVQENYVADILFQ